MNHTANAPTPRPTFRVVLAAAGLPLVVAVAGAWLVWSWRDDLPARVAIHWGTSGADNFASVTTSALLVAAFGMAFAAVGLALALAVRDDSTLARVVAGTSSGTTAFVTVLMVQVIADQRGLTDATTADLNGFAILGALAAGAAAAVVAVYVIPRWGPAAQPPPGDAPRVPVGESELVSWTRSVAAGSPAVALMVLVVGVTAIITVISQLWYVLAVTVVIIALVALMLSIRVTVDKRGLTITGALGWPKFRTPLDEIEYATTVQVRPIRHFGGYGFRVAALGPYRGASGFIMRGGTGVLLQRTTGRRTVVVIDDARTAAGLINALVERDRNG